MDVKLEKDATFTIGLGKAFLGLALDSQNGTFAITGGKSGSKGKAAFSVGGWHKVTVNVKGTAVTATLDGQALSGGSSDAGAGVDATVAAEGNGGYYIMMSLDRYVMADVDNFKLSV